MDDLTARLAALGVELPEVEAYERLGAPDTALDGAIGMSKADAALAAAVGELERARALNDRWNKATSVMTPGGSEFINDPEFTAEYVAQTRRDCKQLYRRVLDGVRERKKAEAEVARLEAAADRSSEFVDGLDPIFGGLRQENVRLRQQVADLKGTVERGHDAEHT